MRKTPIQKNKGFVILFAVLVSAIILLIGAGIFSISFKETVLASMARESQLSINAADAGVECALYNDIATNDLTTMPFISCNDTNVSVTWPIGTQTGQGHFTLFLDNANEASCAEVNFKKDIVIDPLSGLSVLETVIIAQGFNICTPNNGPSTNDPILVERVYRVKYQQAYVSP